MKQFIQRHSASVISILNGFDRLRVRGTKRLLSTVECMNSFLLARGLRFKDFADYVKDVTDKVRRATEGLAEAAGRPIRYLDRSGINKEEIAREIVQKENLREGLICVLSCVEPCWSYQIIRNRQTRHLDLAGGWTKCLHYYHYYLHPTLGFIHMRLQTWFPFTVHVCLNGREWLARQMDSAGLGYERRENCFVHLEDPKATQELMDEQLRVDWPTLLNALVPMFNPVESDIFPETRFSYYWSADESEWATDILFRSPEHLAALYPRLIRYGMEYMSSREVMRFLGRRVPTTHGGVRRGFGGEVVTDLRERPEGIRIKHRIKQNWIKMYDKQGVVLRVETVINNPRDMQVYRPKESDPQKALAWQPLRKGVADLYRRAQVSQASNERYLAALSAVEAGIPLGKLTQSLCHPVEWKGKRVRALNPLSPEDAKLLEAVNRGEFVINGFRNRDLQALLFEPSAEEVSDAKERRRRSAAVTRKLRMLRAHGLITKVQKTHRYTLTAAGRRTITALLAARAADAAKLTAAA